MNRLVIVGLALLAMTGCEQSAQEKLAQIQLDRIAERAAIKLERDRILSCESDGKHYDNLSAIIKYDIADGKDISKRVNDLDNILTKFKIDCPKIYESDKVWCENQTESYIEVGIDSFEVSTFGGYSCDMHVGDKE